MSNPALLPIGAILASTVTGGGLWFVMRLIVRYQRDFADRYAQRIREQESYIEELQAVQHELNRLLMACRTERGALRATLRIQGVQWIPEDYGAVDE